MSKLIWPPGNMLYPLPVVMVSCGDNPSSYNIITISWTGTICTEPAMVSVSIRPERHSYNIIKKNKCFVINLVNEDLSFAADWCGVKSGKDHDKFKLQRLTPKKASKIKAPIIAESPVNIECQLEQILPLGSHDLFLAKIVAVQVSEKYLDSNNKFHLDKTNPICYSHGFYYSLAKEIGHFGFSVKKSKKNN